VRHGLTIRWSLQGVPEGTGDRLRSYVLEESAPRSAGLADLHSEVWQIVDGGFFAGAYVWETAQARTAFLERFRADPSQVSQIIGADPESVSEWDVVALLEGGQVR